MTTKRHGLEHLLLLNQAHLLHNVVRMHIFEISPRYKCLPIFVLYLHFLSCHHWLFLLMRACAIYTILLYNIYTYKTQRDASVVTIYADGVISKDSPLCESSNKTMSWSHHAPDTRFELAGVDSNNDADVFIQNESMSFDETSRLALLSTPPLEKEDERTTHAVLSFGSVMLRWNHSNYWTRRTGKLKSTSLLLLLYSDDIFTLFI